MPQISPEDSQLLEIKELERQLARKRAALGLERPSEVSDIPLEETEYSPGWTEAARERAREAGIEEENQIETMASTVKPVANSSTVSPGDDRAEEVARDIKSILAMDEDRRIQTLSALAWQKGISYSIKVARGLDDPYTLDLLHSQLSGELHDKLVAAKKLDDL